MNIFGFDIVRHDKNKAIKSIEPYNKNSFTIILNFFYSF